MPKTSETGVVSGVWGVGCQVVEDGENRGTEIAIPVLPNIFQF